MIDDFSSGVRQIRRNPGFACAVVLTLALGIGAPTAVFTLADPMLFRPLPYPDAGGLVRVSATGAGTQGGGMHLADYFAARQGHRGFEHVALWWGPEVARHPATDDLLLGYRIHRGFLEMLRVDPIIGRRFLDSEYQTPPATADVALITWDLWQSGFGGRPDIVGQTLDVPGAPPAQVQIVGVLPRTFVFPDHLNQSPGLLLPGDSDPAEAANPYLIATFLARLKPGVTLETARADMQAIVSATEREHPGFLQGREVRIVPLQEALFGSVQTPLLMLLAATLCLLLLACANLAHLFMARLHARRREIGVRLGLGGRPSRLVRQVLAESALLLVAGGAAALVLAHGLFTVIMAYTPLMAHVYRLLPARVDARVAAFAAMLMLGALFVCAVLPAYAAARADLRANLGGAGTLTGSRRTRWVQRSLIGAQAALAVVVFVTSALIGGSFYRLAYQPYGWKAHELRSITITLPDIGPADSARAYDTVYDQLTTRWPDRLTMTDGIPGLTLPGSVIAVESDPSASPARAPAYRGTETVFAVLGLTLVRGRTFDAEDVRLGAAVAVIDEHAAEGLWPGEDPMGREIVHSDSTIRTVIGVVAAVRTRLLSAESGAVFLPLHAGSAGFRHLLTTEPASLPLDDVRQIVHEVEPAATVRISPVLMFERVLGQPRFLAVLLGVLSALTAALAIVGVFGVVGHQTAQRRQEVGIRLALGAQRGRVRRMIVGDALLPASAGIAAGLLASVAWTQSLRGLLYELEPNDPATLAAAAVLVVAIVATASLVPAVSASRTDPMTTLRTE